MGKIDISSWKEFKIEDLFEIKRPMNRSQSNYENGMVPFVASGNYNNGILKYLKPLENEILDKGNCITVSPVDGSAFYQKDDFLGRGGAGSSIILLYNSRINLYSGYFIATIIRKVCEKYLYNDMGSKDTIKKEKIKLPVDKQGNPDFSYMESYMKNLEVSVSSSLTKLASEQDSKKSIDITKWKGFHLYDLFKIDAGTKMDKIAMSFLNPKINFIGRTGINNGVTTCVDEVKGYTPYKAGNLTLALGGAYLGSCFVQKKDFYTSQNVIVLIPKEKMSLYAKLFISAVIFKKGNTHYKAFIDELNRHIKTDFTIKLPVDSNGNLNFKYMEDYIKETKNTVLNKFEKFNYLVS